MSSAKGKLVRLFGSLLLSHAKVIAAEAVGGFRRLRLQGDGLKVHAGDKVQVLLPSDDVRTYTPIAWRDGSIVVLGWTHANGPGAKWLAQVEVGSDVSFARPQRSLSLPEGPVILVGDETSVGVAASFEVAQPGQVQAVFQGASPDSIRAAAASVELQSVKVVAQGDTKTTVEAILQAREAATKASIVLTGGSELVVAVRAALREQGIRDVKTKAYWIPGKVGLD
jgi:NADPH-dependent ferric siderophore reductase